MRNISPDKKRELLVVFIYFCLAVLTTYPLVFKFATHVAHDPPNDAYYCLWSLWWSKTALFDFHTNPLFTNLHFYPYGTSIIFGTQFHGTGLLASPAQLIFHGLRGLIIEYNFIIFFSLVVSAYGAYLLANYICGHRGAAFVAGIIYAFTPMRMFNMVRLQYFSIQWIPFFALFFIKTLREDKKRNPILAAIFFSLILFDYLGYGLDMVFLGILAVVLVPIFAKKIELAPLARRLALFVLAVTILTLPYTAMLLREIRSNPNVYSQATVGITLKCLVSPPSNSTMYKALHDTVDDQFDFERRRNISRDDFILSILASAKKQPFMRYSVIALLLYSMYIVLRSRRSVAYWPIIAVFFCLMSFGPRFVLWDARSLDIPTLYSLLSILVPPLRMARTTDEYMFHFTLAAAVICSVGLAALFDRIKSGASRIVLLSAVAVAILAESLVVPLNLIAPEVSMAYEMINADRDDFTILELPTDDVMFLSRQFLHQTYHGKKLLSGMSVRNSPETRKLMEAPFVKWAQDPPAFLQMPLSSRSEILDENKKFFEMTKLKYVVVNRLAYLVFASEYRVSSRDLERYLKLNGFEKVFEDEREAVFRRTG